jgi:hypothetical protein
MMSNHNNYYIYPRRVSCPHCGFKTVINLDDWSTLRPIIVICDMDEGGCDMPFAVQPVVKLDIEFTTWTLV